MLRLGLVLCLLGGALQDSIYNLKFVKQRDAKCLDGTPGAYYISEGSGVNRTKFLIYFEGGGWCGDSNNSTTIENCYQRSLTDLGSSKNYAQKADLGSWGLLSGNPSVNALYYDWTRVYLKYCDGTGHQGTRSAPVSYKGSDLYFRGANITVAQLADVHEALGLFDLGAEIVVSGCSAGGLAAYTWANYVYSNAKGRVVTAPDSGLFLDSVNVNTKDYSYRNGFINFMKFSNEEVDPPIPECVMDFPNEKWKCLFAQYQFPYIKTPLFPVEPLYDSWSVPNILGISCLNGESLSACTAEQRAALESYRANTTSILKAMVASGTRNGAWAPSCANHCYMHYGPWNSPSYRVPGGSAFSIQASVEQWMRNPADKSANSHIDGVAWPSNAGCSGATAQKLIVG